MGNKFNIQINQVNKPKIAKIREDLQYSTSKSKLQMSNTRTESKNLLEKSNNSFIKRKLIRITVDFSTQTFKVRKAWIEVFQTLKK